MKKSISRLLARMARDGDIDTVAEFIGEMIGEAEEIPAAAVETPAEAVAEAAAEAVVAVEEAVEAAAEEPVAGTAPIAADEEGLAGVIERLDRLIALLTPQAPAGEPAADEEPDESAITAEEIAGIVEEAVEAAQVEGGEPEGSDVPADAAEEIAELIESVLDPEASVTIGEGDEDPEDTCDPYTSDAMKAALAAVRPALSEMSSRRRKQVSKDIAARFPRASRNGRDKVYAEAGSAPLPPVTADLGRRIMASRNPNYKK